MSDAESVRLAVGDVVGGRYRIDRVIGVTGMSEVYAASHMVTRHRVALKLLRGNDSEDSRRLLREAQAATAFESEYVVNVRDIFEDDELVVLVMDLLVGESLESYEERVGTLALADAADIFVGVGKALVAAHAKGVIHRDLKPANIFLATIDGARKVKVLDFGIAKILDPAALGLDSFGVHTETGTLIGTASYMSLEQVMTEKEIDRRTDVWSFGVCFLEAICGRRPLQYESMAQMYGAFFQERVPRARELAPSLPEDVAAVMDGCLQKDREQRTEDLTIVVKVLERYASRDVALDVPIPHPPRDGTIRRVVVGVGATLLTAIVAGTAWHFRAAAAESEPKELVSVTKPVVEPTHEIPSAPEPSQEPPVDSAASGPTEPADPPKEQGTAKPPTTNHPPKPHASSQTTPASSQTTPYHHRPYPQ
jgi:serine/threonine-protein kinase